MVEEKIFGLIGFPLTHSFSQSFFNRKFDAEGINARYLNFELEDIGDLMEVFAQYPTLSGLNVTIPYKQQVIPYMDSMDPKAAEVGAVNVIRIDRGEMDNDFRLKGYNTDLTGFSRSISPLLTPERRRALVLGSGGASKAVTVALRDLGVMPVVVSRTPSEDQLSYSDIDESVMNSHHIIVNTTPVGMYPHTDECPDIPYRFLTPAHLCYDLIYNPEMTLFLRKASEHGAQIKNGLEMLTIQAEESWKIWNKK